MKKNKEINEAKYYKERNKSFSKYNEDELCKFFKSVKCASIVMSYPNSLEKDVYKHVASILKNRYPKYCDENDIEKTLSLYGNIYTAKIYEGLGDAIYHINSANILIYSFLNKLNESLVHELIHKLGYLNFNEDFYQMPKIYIESGTELITNSVMNNPLCRELILGRMWTRCVGVQPRYLIETTLVNQLNMACGQDVLERSILQGKNYIEPEIINLIGKEKYNVLFAKMQDICLLEKMYWKSGKKQSREQAFYKKVLEFQDDVLKEIFGARIKKVENKEDAEELLNELMHFSDFRVRLENPSEKDEIFDVFFNEQKKLLEEKFNTRFKIKDITSSWKGRYPVIMQDKDKLAKQNLEKSKIDAMVDKKNVGFWGRIFKSKKDTNILSSGIQKDLVKNNNLDYLKSEKEETKKTRNVRRKIQREDIEK